jgi:outer membrane protein assembly factor BamB
MTIAKRVAVVLVIIAVLVIALAVSAGDTDEPDQAQATLIPTAAVVTPVPTVPEPTTEPTLVPTPTPTPYAWWVDPATSGQPFGDTVEGILTFRGSPTRSYYGAGPVPVAPQIVWSFPDTSMCSESSVGSETTTWCGTGWTGQPSVWERDGQTLVSFGAYDRAVHLLDADTGDRIVDDFVTGDIIKGSVSVDPDGFPLIYSGSRDNYLHILSYDQGEFVELWRLDAYAVSPTLWNDDWDGSPLIIDDYLFEGGENSNIHIVKLNRGYDAKGKVTVDPELVFHAPGWDAELTAIHGSNVSIENSVAISGNTLWFANSGGLVQGWDITGLKDGVTPERIFRWWSGDDVDASLVIDDEGFIYVAAEYEKSRQRSLDVGQLIKLDPTKPDDPVVWSFFDHGTSIAGIWATPAIYKDVVVTSTDGGRVVGLDRATGEIRWEKRLPGPVWSSQVVVDDVLIQGDCAGVLHAYDLSDTTIDPPELWSVNIGGCIESTPAVWDGVIYVGTRGGRFHAIADVPVTSEQ